jgi:hypothetical protein
MIAEEANAIAIYMGNGWADVSEGVVVCAYVYVCVRVCVCGGGGVGEGGRG